ncbi:uncharacterized protein LOC132701039 [Cylas formicarius]|uniref:uncharacterized protein LOC132701039 n=1 Tax=Cylas formicarius TaxID=197179 RepID=UPI00295832D9|nr:uncharacterized protein LOC132701039 [Cylas formicarius]
MFMKPFISLIVGVCLLAGHSARCYQENHRRPDCGNVHLTVSPTRDTNLELNWISDCEDDSAPEFIVFSRKHLRDTDENSIILKLKAADYPRGYYKTSTSYGHPWLPGNWEYSETTNRKDMGPYCLPYWITSVRGERIIDENCLAIQPTWMYDNRQTLGSQKIGSIFIPGTHNSGSYDGIPAFLEGYVLNQDRDVWTQLVHGIRYLDFRVGFYHREGFFINHDQVKVINVETVLDQIKKFVELAPSEVVVVDFHRFPYPSNFTAEMHRKFTDLVYRYLGDHALSPSGLQVGKGPTLNEIWAQNKSVIICYSDRNTVRETFWLWQPLQQFWGDTNSVSSLKGFLTRSIKQHRTTINPMWALMAELTPQPLDFILRINNLRNLAQKVNREVTKWFREEWFYDANVVATDYFLSNDLIAVAIDANSRK